MTVRPDNPGSTAERADNAAAEQDFPFDFSKLVHALSTGYERIFYIDQEDNSYREYSSPGKYADLSLIKSGTDFFADAALDIARNVYEGDRVRLGRALRRKTLLASLKKQGFFTITYQYLDEGGTRYHSLKAVQFDDDGRPAIAIGLRDVDELIRSARRIGEHSGFTPDFTGLAKALSRDIESIYYVDVETDDYLEYVSEGSYELLEIETSGKNFFDECQHNIQQTVFSEDWEKVASAMDKAALLQTLRKRGSFSMDYRLVIEGKPTYYRMKIIPAETGGFRHIIIGVSNVDAQISEEQRLAAEQQNLESFSRIAQALTQDNFLIYYVDVESDYFIEFSAEGSFKNLGIETRGEDFFKLSRRNMPRFVHPADLPGFLAVFTKENVLREIDANGSFSIPYRMMLDGEPKYVLMKATRLDPRHIVIGTSNVTAEVQRQRAADVKSGIAQALASDYFLIFYVDTETDRFVEYHATETDRELDIEQGGEDFFTVSRVRFLPDVCEEYRDTMYAVIDKDSLLQLLDEAGSYTLEFRMRLNGVPTYVHMKASRMVDRSDPHIVIGLSNIDSRVRRDQAQARALQQATELVSRDALTGVKSKRAFIEAEMQWDGYIEVDPDISFAVAVFDLNGLKKINDTLGHAAGDSYIRAGSAAICTAFHHSPVYRIGGDEFAAILSTSDYDNRAELIARFRAENAARAASGGVVVAAGLSEYYPGIDTRFQDVFDRADAEMYENKKALKEL